VGTLILLRHGRSTANNDGVLAGRSDGVDLDDTGRQQAADLVGRLSGTRIAALVSSPLLRCRRTLEPLATALGLPVTCDDRVAEVDYGSWTGRKLSELSTEPMWSTVQ
jgi:broad specificity phosphatase PhoE